MECEINENENERMSNVVTESIVKKSHEKCNHCRDLVLFRMTFAPLTTIQKHYKDCNERFKCFTKFTIQMLQILRVIFKHYNLINRVKGMCI